MTDQPDFIDTIIDEMEDTHGAREFFSTTYAAVRAAIERGIREKQEAEVVGAMTSMRAEEIRALIQMQLGQTSAPRRTLTIDLDTGDWVAGGPLTEGDGYRVASSVLPGMPVEAVDVAYGAWMSADEPRGVPMTSELRAMFEKRTDS